MDIVLEEFEEEGQSDAQQTETITYVDWLKHNTERVETIAFDLQDSHWEKIALTRKFKWVGHILRRNDERVAKKVILQMSKLKA